jgi:hypothetical protein
LASFNLVKIRIHLIPLAGLADKRFASGKDAAVEVAADVLGAAGADMMTLGLVHNPTFRVSPHLQQVLTANTFPCRS